VTEASDTFLEQFGGVGSPSLTCNCGRRHHAPDSRHIDAKEREEMLADHRENPTKVQLWNDDDGVSAKHFGNRTMVLGCLCNTLGKLEEIIWNERAAIIGYYQQRRRRDVEQLAGLDDASKVTP
jgi:hypothetical protein